MKVRKLPLILFLLILATVVANAAWHYPLLPDRVASHFDLSGNPDGWSSKRSFIIANFTAIGLIATTTLGCAFGIFKLPVTMTNLPNREFWLAEERVETSIRKVSDYLLWLGSATMLFLGFVFHQAFQVSLGEAQTLQFMMPLLIVYFSFSLVWTVALVVHFSKKPVLEE